MPILPSLNSIKAGLTLVIENEPYFVQEASFMRTAQRKPVMRTKLKSVKTGKVREVSFKPGDKVEGAEIEKIKMRYLYKDQRFTYFMDGETFEQHSIANNILGEKLNFLKEGEEITLIKFRGTTITVELPIKVRLKIISTAPAIRGDTAQGNVTKEAVLETGAKAQVPLFVKENDIIVVNTETGQYVERAS